MAYCANHMYANVSVLHVCPRIKYLSFFYIVMTSKDQTTVVRVYVWVCFWAYVCLQICLSIGRA